MSVLIWTLVGMAIWHFMVFLPDKFVGGIIGALLAALAGALLSGYMLPQPGLPSDNPPGVSQALWPMPGCVLLLSASYWWGARTQTLDTDVDT